MTNKKLSPSVSYVGGRESRGKWPDWLELTESPVTLYNRGEQKSISQHTTC